MNYGVEWPSASAPANVGFTQNRWTAIGRFAKSLIGQPRTSQHLVDTV
jgi:hypothetical protein